MVAHTRLGGGCVVPSTSSSGLGGLVTGHFKGKGGRGLAVHRWAGRLDWSRVSVGYHTPTEVAGVWFIWGPWGLASCVPVPGFRLEPKKSSPRAALWGCSALSLHRTTTRGSGCVVWPGFTPQFGGFRSALILIHRTNEAPRVTQPTNSTPKPNQTQAPAHQSSPPGQNHDARPQETQDGTTTTCLNGLCGSFLVKPPGQANPDEPQYAQHPSPEPCPRTRTIGADDIAYHTPACGGAVWVITLPSPARKPPHKKRDVPQHLQPTTRNPIQEPAPRRKKRVGTHPFGRCVGNSRYSSEPASPNQSHDPAD
ncbi:hypothetical protein BS47DRAFT_1369585 [Hydnum rufescens UP504]|uniref:Uncharacterized protein n=1 Tax=Hydnum rufescens UP504 TaxID=1448309 RepID=A0A9P6ACE4_9AGAM|nr:hypothetical protein BS47DRAFT_1369585 [Hydnum rufescens UP504]